jgi:glycosyltransferase involved in cell wall biosynthesis
MITKGVWGGAQKYVYTLATSLPKESFEPVVLCGTGEELPQKLKEAHIPVHSLPTLHRDISVIKEIRSFLSLVAYIKKEKPDVLHLNSPKIGGLGALAGRCLGIKQIIYTAHGWPFNEQRSTGSKTAIWLLSWITVLLSHKTIVIAEKEKDQALDMPFISSQKISFIKNGIEKIDFLPKIAARKEISLKVGRNIPAKAFWIGSIAELHKNKGLEYAIVALSKISHPVVYVIMGEGEERIHLERLIKKHIMQDKVVLCGFTKDASRYIKAFDCYLLPSIKEGLPYALLEAGSGGVPGIASKVGGIPDIIENGTHGILTTAGQVGEISRAIQYMIDNPEKIKLYGKNIKKRIDHEFSLEKMIRQTMAIYSEGPYA